MFFEFVIRNLVNNEEKKMEKILFSQFFGKNNFRKKKKKKKFEKTNDEMRGVLWKLRLPTFFCFFWMFFFLCTFKKNLFCQKKEIVYENIPFCFFIFFATLFRKDIVEWNNAMSHKSNIFRNQNAPSHKKIQNMETRKNKTMKRKKTILRGDIFNSWYFRKYRNTKIPRQQHLWEKNQLWRRKPTPTRLPVEELHLYYVKIYPLTTI